MKKALFNIMFAMVCAPLLSGIINRVKAVFSGCKGQPLLQLYYDLKKLTKKGAVYSSTTTFLFWVGPLIGLAAVVTLLLILPQAGGSSLVAFPGDIVLFLYMFGLMRFVTVIAAMDTGSSFEGMGSSREVQFAVFAEPAMFLGFIALVRKTGSISLTEIYSSCPMGSNIVVLLVCAVFFIIFLAENSRIPVDDPNTHLELTMIHEVMVLDHGGPDFAVISYAASLKLWVLGSLVVGALFPVCSGNFLQDEIIFFAGMIFLCVTVGIVESCMARLRLLKVPQLLIAGFALAIIALIFQIR